MLANHTLHFSLSGTIKNSVLRRPSLPPRAILSCPIPVLRGFDAGFAHLARKKPRRNCKTAIVIILIGRRGFSDVTAIIVVWCKTGVRR
jgi:hypothetical protein